MGTLTSTGVSRQGFDLLQFREILLGGNNICRKGVDFADAGRSSDTFLPGRISCDPILRRRSSAFVYYAAIQIEQMFFQNYQVRP